MPMSPLFIAKKIPPLKPAVLVIILNWNSHEETIAAVESVLKMDYPNCRIAVIDNGSEPDSFQALASLAGERTQITRSPENLGYTGGCNLGFELAVKAGVNYAWLLNSDAITEPGTLTSLVTLAETDPAIALVSPIIASLQKPNDLMSVGGLFDPAIPTVSLTRKIEVGQEWTCLHPDRIMLFGTGLLVRVAVLNKLDGFDQDLFAYWEDLDLSMRAIQAGFRNVIDFDSTVLHTVEYPDDSSHGVWPHEAKPHFWYYMARNEIRFWKKHAPAGKKLKTIWWSYQMQLKHLKRHGGNELFRQAICAGLWDGWLNRTGAWNLNRHMPGLVVRLVQFHSRQRAT